MKVPAFCDNCGAIFPSGIEVADGQQGVYFEGNRARCPVCGHWARTPDGLFNFTATAVEVLQAPDRTVEDLRRFEAVLRDLRERGASGEEVRETLRRETPSLANFLPQNRTEMLQYIAILIAALQLLLTAPPDIDIHDVDLNIENIIEVTIQQEQNGRTEQLSE
jgi:hypothetical protein